MPNPKFTLDFVRFGLSEVDARSLLARGMPVELMKNEIGAGVLVLLLNALDNRGEMSKSKRQSFVYLPYPRIVACDAQRSPSLSLRALFSSTKIIVEYVTL